MALLETAAKLTDDRTDILKTNAPLVAISTSALLLAVTACSGATSAPSVAPGDGPATSVAASTVPSPSASATPLKPTPSETTATKVDCDAPAAELSDKDWAAACNNGEVAQEGGDEQQDTEPIATFKDKYTYDDGVQVEVTKIRHGRTTRNDVSSEQKAGLDFVMLTVRVKNGSKQKLEVYTSNTLTYGADGDEAQVGVLADFYPSSMTGTILPGKSKTEQLMYLIKKSDQKDPVLEFSFDMEHDAAIFSGSLN